LTLFDGFPSGGRETNLGWVNSSMETVWLGCMPSSEDLSISRVTMLFWTVLIVVEIPSNALNKSSKEALLSMLELGEFKEGRLKKVKEGRLKKVGYLGLEQQRTELWFYLSPVHTSCQ
jgi:hypothetical protein